MTVDEEHRVFYCHIPKAGYTTVMSLLEAATSVGEKVHLRKKDEIRVHIPKYMRSMGLTRLGDYTGWY